MAIAATRPIIKTDELDSGLTRRQAIGASAAAAAGTVALPTPAEARLRKTSRRTRHADVIVVGAGLSGLTAAKEIVAAGKSVLVLEARGRVGGRTLNHDIGDGKVIEVGGEWVGPTQDEVIKLAKELDVSTFKTYNDGKYIYYRNGMATPYEVDPVLGAVPPDPTGIADAFSAILKINQMASELSVDTPWTASRAEEFDSQTCRTWIDANTTSDSGKFLLEVMVQALWAAEPRDVSFLHVLFYTRAATNDKEPVDFQRLINTAGGAQESRFVGGSQLISINLARHLGKRVLLGRPVRRISQAGRCVQVLTDRETFVGRSVIVTAPPAVSAFIDYEPGLPADRAQLLQRFPQGNAIKCEAIYDKPFWRDAGLAGQIVSDAEPVRVTFDNSPPDGSPGVMLGFIEGAFARKWARKSAQERRQAVLKNFATYFGDQALKPRDYVEMNWASERWTRGCYVGFTPPGVLLDYGPAIRTPVGRIHWAGAETATLWNGYMDGAVRSGRRAAKEALAGD